MKKLLIATKNKHKLEEFQSILGSQYSILSLFDFPEINDIEETGATFEENAIIKARTLYEMTGESTISDDSGLVVNALHGAPGVYSARYSGQNATDASNRTLLLQNMNGIDDRSAYFECCIALIGEDRTNVFAGQFTGTIGVEERGSNGFGYDPIFIPDGHQRTLAEFLPSEKNEISHRAIASKKLLDYLLKK